MPVPKDLREAHERGLPGKAFYPSSIRPMNRSVVDAAFLNWLYGVDASSAEAVDLIDRIQGDLLQPTTRAAHKVGLAVISEVMFGTSEGRSGRQAPVLRVSHPRIGRYYVPKTFRLRDWIDSLFAHGGVTDSTLEQLTAIANRAEQRPQTVFERAVLAALNNGSEPENKGGLNKVKLETASGRPPSDVLHRHFGAWINRAVGGRARGAETPDQAEQLLADVRRLVELFIWLYWYQLHINAGTAIAAYANNQPPDFKIEPIWFGFADERDVQGRPFADQGKALPDQMFNGSVALNALTAANNAAGWDPALWFDEIWKRQEQLKKSRASIKEWHAKYLELSRVEAEGIQDGESLPTMIHKINSAIRAHYQTKNDQDKFPLTVGYGVLRDMGQADECCWMRSLGKNRGQAPIIDEEFLMLVARTLAAEEPRVRLVEIFEDLSRIGMEFDDATKRQIRLTLESNGRVKSLSDSGEAVYVQVR